MPPTILLVHCNQETAGGTRVTLPRLGVRGDDDHPYILMDKSILEAHWYKAPHSSWFVGQTVVSGKRGVGVQGGSCFWHTCTLCITDGGVHLVTRVDPLYFVLHHLWRACLEVHLVGGILAVLSFSWYMMMPHTIYVAYAHTHNLLPFKDVYQCRAAPAERSIP